VSSFYLTELFGDDRVITFDDRVPDSGPVRVSRSAVCPTGGSATSKPTSTCLELVLLPGDGTARGGAVRRGRARQGVRYVVSPNSRNGRHVQVGDEVGVREQVRSAMIIELFEQRGYELCARYNQPLIRAAGELAVLRLT